MSRFFPICFFLLLSTAPSSSSSSSPSSRDVEAPVCGKSPLSSDLSARLLDRLLRTFSSSSSSSSSSDLLTLESLIEATAFFHDAPSGNFSSIRSCILDDDVAAAAAAAAAVATTATLNSTSGDANSTTCLLLACGRLSIGESKEEEEEERVIVDATADPVELSALLRGLMLDALEGRCSADVRGLLPDSRIRPRVPWQKSVAYGSAFAATVVVGSQFGGLLYPLRNHIAYKVCLTYLIGLACGTLGAGGILHLMPACFGLHEQETSSEGGGGSHGEEYGNHVFHATAMLAGAYLFYWIEMILRDVSAWKKSEALKKATSHSANRTPADSRYHSRHTLHSEPPVFNVSRAHSEVFDDELLPPPDYEHINADPDGGMLRIREKTEDVHSARFSLQVEPRKRKMSARSFASHASNIVTDDADMRHEEGEIAPIAWILIMAKIFSTFIDGLTMGAAFTETIAIGIKIGIAIICEEYPHELGDIAVLLNSGMTFKRALLWNFIAAAAVFPGVYVGIAAGESSDANPWIFAVASGMFVYISFVDMVPEVAALRDELMEAGLNYWLVLLIQHLGLLSGFMLMFMMAIYGDEIA